MRVLVLKRHQYKYSIKPENKPMALLKKFVLGKKTVEIETIEDGWSHTEDTATVTRLFCVEKAQKPLTVDYRFIIGRLRVTLCDTLQDTKSSESTPPSSGSTTVKDTPSQ